MRASPAILSACLLLCATAQADKVKKEMIVTVSDHVQQVNNHPYAYTTPGHSNTTCNGTGTVNGTATTIGSTTDINGQVYTNTDCSTTSNPARTTTGNRVTVSNSAWLTDTATGDQYLIECTASWVGSKCSNLIGQSYKAVLDGNNIIIFGKKGMKDVSVKYHVREYLPKQGYVPASTPAANVPTAVSKQWTGEERFTWEWYNSLSEDDRNYVHEFCPANPTGKALLPHAKVLAGQNADRAMDCGAWNSAKAKL
jgi:hypothetical protein